MRRHRGTIISLVTIGVLMTSLTSYLSTRAASPSSTSHTTVQVAIQNYAFSPASLTVATGTTVTWTNKDSVAHTVTSDTGGWTDSGNLASSASFSVTFSKPGTYPYHCTYHSGMTATVVVSNHPSATSGTGPTGMSPNMMAMGKASTLMLKSWTGYYDGKTLTYISTDTSSKSEASQDQINYSASLSKSLPAASKIYFVSNGAFSTRGAVFGSTLGADDYTPLWQEIVVSWKHTSDAVLLTSDNQINDLVSKGKLSLRSTGIVLNCPIIARSAAHM